MSTNVGTVAVTFFIKLVTIFAVLGTSGAAEYTDSLTVSETKSASSNIITSGRHKRAPGWGKRAPGWGKRAPGWGKRAPGWGKRNDMNYDLFDQPDSVLDRLSRVQALRPNSYTPEDVSFSEKNKRAPGWGKRSCDEDAYSSKWLKDRSNAIPHWGKRSSETEQDNEVIETEKRSPGWGKRAPGWGKRNSQIDLSLDDADVETGFDNWDSNVNVDQELYENLENSKEPTESNTVLPATTLLSGDLISVERRAPGWGKRAPGWGKRSYQFETVDEDVQTEKRAPGWGKRAPGWGKRAPGWGKRAPGWGKRNYEPELDDDVADKRAPGWGKRATSRVKRSPNFLRLSKDDNCNKLQLLENVYITRIKELAARRSTECGNMNDANKPFGK